MKKIFISFFLLISFLIFSQSKTINIVTDEWEGCTNKDLTGLYFDLLREVYEKNGYTLNIKFEPYSRTITSVQLKRADMMIGIYLDETKDIIYPKTHFAADDVVALYLKGKITKWEGEKSLLNKKVAWIREYNYNKYINVNLDFQIVDKRESGINLLNKERIDIFIDNQYDITETLKEMKLDIKNYELKLIKYLNLYFGYAVTDKGKELAAFWDAKFPPLVKSGKIKKIFIDNDMLNNYNF